MFLPGVSTKDVADEMSGRGVGMDVVKTNIARLSGIIDVESEPGQGTRLTHHAADHAGDHPGARHPRGGAHLRGAAQLGARDRCSSRSDDVRDHRAARGDDAARADAAAGAPGAAVPARARATRGACRSKQFVVVVGMAQHRIGLLVDELLGQQDIVIKSLGQARSTACPASPGATELGGKKTVLVLDVAAIVEEAVDRRRRRRRRERACERVSAGWLRDRGDRTACAHRRTRLAPSADGRARRLPHRSSSAARSTASTSCTSARSSRCARSPRCRARRASCSAWSRCAALVLPVVDLRSRLRLDAHAAHARRRASSWSMHEGERFGLLVDEVRGVVRFADARDRAAAADRWRRSEAPFLAGIGRYPEDGEERMVILLTLDAVLGFEVRDEAAWSGMSRRRRRLERAQRARCAVELMQLVAFARRPRRATPRHHAHQGDHQPGADHARCPRRRRSSRA